MKIELRMCRRETASSEKAVPSIIKAVLFWNSRVLKQATLDNLPAVARWDQWLDLIGVITSWEAKYFKQEPIQRIFDFSGGILDFWALREMEYRCCLLVFATADLNSFQGTSVFLSSPRQI